MDHKDFQTETSLTRWWPLFVLLIVSSAAAVLASLKTSDTALPWWYTFILRLKVPAWLIIILEKPWFITGAMAIFFLSKLAVVAFLTAQLIITRRKLSRLIEAYRNLEHEHDTLKNNFDTQKVTINRRPSAEQDDATDHRG